MRYPCGMNKADKNIPGRWLYIAGGALTLIYLAALAWYSVGRWAEIRVMQPNNLGDFLSGSFSPLAFAWLVLGFIQQGIELRQNSTALLLQAEELRTAAMHAGAMVELQRKDFELRIQELEEARKKADASKVSQAKRREEQAIREMQPRFRFGLAMRDYQREHIVKGALTNEGPGCASVRILMEPIPGILELASAIEFAEFSSRLEHPIVFISRGTTPLTQPLTIHYTDAGGTERCQNFIVSVNDSHVSIVERDG